MKNATLKQAGKILKLIEDVPCEQVQDVLASGLLHDLFYANINTIDRDAFRKFVGLKELLSGNSYIMIKSEASSRDLLNSFFKNGPVRLLCWGNFLTLLKEMPKVIPVFGGTLRKTKIVECMFDWEILKGLGYPAPFFVAEFVAIIHELLRKQSKGEVGTLLTNGFPNIFYVAQPEVRDLRTCIVIVTWLSDVCSWCLKADYFDGHCGKSGGSCVFSR